MFLFLRSAVNALSLAGTELVSVATLDSVKTQLTCKRLLIRSIFELFIYSFPWIIYLFCFGRKYNSIRHVIMCIEERNQSKIINDGDVWREDLGIVEVRTKVQLFCDENGAE